MYEYNARGFGTKKGLYVASNGLAGDSRDVALDENGRRSVVEHLLKPLIKVEGKPHPSLEPRPDPGNEVGNPGIIGYEEYGDHGSSLSYR